MNPTLLKALLALLPVLVLVFGATLLFVKGKSIACLLQLLGAGLLLLVVLMHLCEALDLFPAMQWGNSNSVDHFLDLGSAVLGVTLFHFGYLLYAVTQRAYR
jgi:hypothetical protein